MENNATPKAQDELLAPEETGNLENNSDLKEKLADLKLSLDDSSNKNRGFFVSFLLIQIYLLVAVAGTSDLQLLMPESNLQLPIVNFYVPLFGFYILAPVFLIAFHFNVLFNLQTHSRKLFTWVRYNGAKEDALFLPAFMFNSLTGLKPGLAGYSLLRIIIFSVIYFFPLALLWFIQWRFADYHDINISVWHFIAIMADIFLLTIYWRRIVDPDSHGDEYESWRYLRQSSLYIRALWRIFTILPVFLPIAACFILGNIQYTGETLSKWLFFAGGAFCVIFIFSVLLNWTKLSKETFGRNQKILFSAVYLLPLLWKKEGGPEAPKTRERKGKRPPTSSLKSFYSFLCRLFLKPDPVRAFTLLIAAIALYNPGILAIIQHADLEWYNHIAEKYKKHQVIINLFIPRIDLPEQNLFVVSPYKDIHKNRTKDKEDAWLDAYVGLNLKNRDFILANFDKSVLYKADFRGANLRGANFKGAKLQMAKLGDADLRRADLRHADLRGANSFKSDLPGHVSKATDFRGADLRHADLRGRRLRRADLRGTQLYQADFRGADLKGADLRGANSYKSNFRGACLESADLRGIFLRWADLRGADLFKADLRGAYVESAAFQGTYLDDAKFYGTDATYIRWKNNFGSINTRNKLHLKNLDAFKKEFFGDEENKSLSSENINKILRRMKSNERAWNKKSRSVMERLGRHKSAPEKFLEERGRIACSDEDSALGILRLYRDYYNKVKSKFFKKVFKYKYYPQHAGKYYDDNQKNIRARRDIRKTHKEFLTYMEEKCPRILSKMKKLPNSEKIVRF